MYAEGNVRRARESLWAMRRDRPQIASNRRIDLESVVACEQVAGGQGLARKRDGLSRVSDPFGTFVNREACNCID